MFSTNHSLRNLQFLEMVESHENRRERRVTKRSGMILDDVDFHKRYRLQKSTVAHLLDLIEEEIQPKTHLNNSLNALEQLIIALRFYATGTYQLVLGDLAEVSQSTVSRVITRVSRAIASLGRNSIKMPETEEECLQVSEDFFHIAQFPGVIGCIDCTHVPIISPGGTDAERFRNRKNIFSLNVQTIVSADLVIRNVVARWPGSVHDSTILNNSTVPSMMQSDVLKKYHLLGDGGYPCQPYILTPVCQPSRTRPSEMRYNTSHILTRNTVERSYGVLKQRFPCMQATLRCSLYEVPTIVVACCVLHNLAMKLQDPNPPIDPEVQEYINDFIDEADAHSNAGSSAGFVKRNLLIDRFF